MRLHSLVAPQNRLYRVTLVALFVVTLFSSFAAPAHADVDSALSKFTEFLKGLVGWLFGPGRYLIAAAWLTVGFKTVLGMERGGVGPFVFVGLVGMAIVFAPQILGAMGIEISGWTTQ